MIFLELPQNISSAFEIFLVFFGIINLIGLFLFVLVVKKNRRNQ